MGSGGPKGKSKKRSTSLHTAWGSSRLGVLPREVVFFHSLFFSLKGLNEKRRIPVSRSELQVCVC